MTFFCRYSWNSNNLLRLQPGELRCCPKNPRGRRKLPKCHEWWLLEPVTVPATAAIQSLCRSSRRRGGFWKPMPLCPSCSHGSCNFLAQLGGVNWFEPTPLLTQISHQNGLIFVCLNCVCVNVCVCVAGECIVVAVQDMTYNLGTYITQ